MTIETLELLIPLTYIPGVALLILSTSNRYIHVNDVLTRFTPDECKVQAARVRREFRRARLFRNSLIGLYMSVALFSLGSLMSFFIYRWGISTSNAVLEVFTILGVICIVFAVFSLVYESILTLRLLKRHHKDMMDEDDEYPVG